MYDIEDIELTRREAIVILSFYSVGGIIFALLALAQLLGL